MNAADVIGFGAGGCTRTLFSAVLLRMDDFRGTSDTGDSFGSETFFTRSTSVGEGVERVRGILGEAESF